LFILVKSTIVAAALATTAVGAGAAGTAYSAEPVAYSTATATHLAAPPPNHKFRGKFRTQQDCQRQAQREHSGRAGDWDCRKGPQEQPLGVLGSLELAGPIGSVELLVGGPGPGHPPRWPGPGASRLALLVVNPSVPA